MRLRGSLSLWKRPTFPKEAKTPCYDADHHSQRDDKSLLFQEMFSAWDFSRFSPVAVVVVAAAVVVAVAVAVAVAVVVVVVVVVVGLGGLLGF